MEKNKTVVLHFGLRKRTAKWEQKNWIKIFPFVFWCWVQVLRQMGPGAGISSICTDRLPFDHPSDTRKRVWFCGQHRPSHPRSIPIILKVQSNDWNWVGMETAKCIFKSTRNTDNFISYNLVKNEGTRSLFQANINVLVCFCVTSLYPNGKGDTLISNEAVPQWNWITPITQMQQSRNTMSSELQIREIQHMTWKTQHASSLGTMGHCGLHTETGQHDVQRQALRGTPGFENGLCL